MTLPQRLVNLLYAFRDFAPITNVLALMSLPSALLMFEEHDYRSGGLGGQWSLKILQGTFCASFALNKLYHFIAYSYIGMSRMWNFQSNEIWAAPCKFTTEVLLNTH